MSNPDQARRAMDALKAVGIGFALDDFGCGYASIGALRQFGFNRMKVDRSLVSALKRDKASVCSVPDLPGNGLGLAVTAEDVEKSAPGRCSEARSL